MEKETLKVVKENADSLEIAKNSRGHTYTIKVYGDTAQQLEEKAVDLKARAEKIITEAEQNGGN